jgi:hypothetical protein
MKIRKIAVALVACAAGIGVIGVSAPAAHADSSWGWVVTPKAK